ncbi:MAG TPA: flagellar export chaperone FlgN [Pirellulales bacterium]|nr:flagellar export chaperone FlgN [Pirellulales bacterium]
MENQSWETDIAALLNELSATQDDLFDLLAVKRNLLVASDIEGIQGLESREKELISRLEACQTQRSELLHRAAQQNLPGDSIRSLARSLPAVARANLEKRVDDAAHRSRLLNHQSLTNWALIQRTLIHLSQLLEIIATGGRPKPTYGKGAYANASGSLVDQAI